MRRAIGILSLASVAACSEGVTPPESSKIVVVEARAPAPGQGAPASTREVPTIAAPAAAPPPKAFDDVELAMTAPEKMRDPYRIQYAMTPD